MDLLPVDTTLCDMAGVPHRYETVPFAYDECLDLGLELAALVGGPLGEAFKGLLLGSDLKAANLDQQVLARAVASLGELPARLLQRGGAQLVARVLATTMRIDEVTIRAGTPATKVKQHLRDPAARTAAYSGGNLRESFDAVRWVLEVNYGPFLAAMWDVLRPPLAELASSLGIGPESPEPESETQQSKATSEPVRPTETVS